MSSPVYGIRIESKEKNILTFRVYCIWSDLISLPRTHGFGYLILKDYCVNKNPALEAIDSNNFCKSVYELGRKYIQKLEVSDFKNYPLHSDFINQEWHELDEATKKFDNEEILPNALYSMEVTDEKLLDHRTIGDTWETASADLWGASFYLEHVSEKTQKFYQLYRNDMGEWIRNYGKMGTDGRVEKTYMVDEESAEISIQPKLTKSKGYKLIYKNFDTEFGYEKSMRNK